jgi:hypothetical protein
VAEHRDDAVPRGLPEVECLEVGDTGVNRGAAVGSEAPGFHYTDRTQVDGHDIVAELGEKYAIAAFAVAETERATFR